MRHRVAGRQLSRNTSHRIALRRNMVASLFEHETISTTIQKAKEIRSLAEKLITLAKKGTLAARKQGISMIGNRAIVVEEDEGPVKKGTVIGKLFSEIGPKYLDRAGGYTRIIRLEKTRLGDNGKLVLLQLVGSEEKSADTKSKKTKKASKKSQSEKAQAKDTASKSVEAETKKTSEKADKTDKK